MEEKIIEIEEKVMLIDKEIEQLKNKKHKLLLMRDKIKNEIQEEKSAVLASKDWNREDFNWSVNLKDKMRTVFKMSSLRPRQLPVMNATLSCVDCILIMPTGGGKSLCYQLPALISQGITLVVSPLISLMEDQLMCLDRLNIPAKMLRASCTKEEVNLVHKEMTDRNSNLKLLYVTPEKLSKSKRFMAKLQKMHQMGRFARLAIDEVHCCSHWGHDFRPDYKFLGIMRKMFPGTPIIGLTATASSRVTLDVQKILNIQGCLILKASFNRPNLYYEVRLKPASKVECVEQLCSLLKGEFKGESGIIYTMTIKDAEELANNLRDQGVKVAPYHANLDGSVRSKIHRKWVTNEYQAVVATIAFGMGIDKPDVRFVIHHCISKSMENFYQESGRAGRDDKLAKCIMYWRFHDLSRQSTLVFTENTGLENLYGLIGYCVDSYRCRRQLIADHFDEVWESKDCNAMCDHCASQLITKDLDLTKYGANLIKIIKKAASLDNRLTGQKLVDLWLGKGATNLRVSEATTTSFSRERAESVVAHLLVDGFLKEDFHFTPYSTISYIVAGDKAEAGLPPSPIQVSRISTLETKDTKSAKTPTIENGGSKSHVSPKKGGNEKSDSNNSDRKVTNSNKIDRKVTKDDISYRKVTSAEPTKKRPKLVVIGSSSDSE